ncbi:MAG: cytochrome c [Devosia sp.]
MPLSKITAIASAIVVATLAAAAIAQSPPVVVDPAIATMTNEQLVTARQEAMREDGKILREAGGLLGDDAIAAATHLLQNFTNFPALFREGSVTDKTAARPEIWQNWEAFTAIFAKGQQAATQMLQAAEAEDDDLYQSSVKELGGLCSTCHQQFRGR